MGIKLLNNAGMAAKSPPSQHEQISDLSQVIRSVCEELWEKKKKYKKETGVSLKTFLKSSKSSVSASCFRYEFSVSLSWPGAAEEADCQECTPNSSSSPALAAWYQPETESAKHQPPETSRKQKLHLKKKCFHLTLDKFLKASNKARLVINFL